MKQINRITFLISFLFLLGGASFAQISPFAEGYWVKVAIKESGVYKLPFDTLRAWGFDDPEHIGVYG
ncbi:MAG: hypothetical protein PF444_03590, partial [Bacteroidales bacterium]|nr:hypothetical protein [Bacteroidales bacterium]